MNDIKEEKTSLQLISYAHATGAIYLYPDLDLPNAVV